VQVQGLGVRRAGRGGCPHVLCQAQPGDVGSGGVGQAGRVAGGPVGLAGAEHRQDDVAAAAGEADHGGVVTFAFGSFLVVERLGCGSRRWVPCRTPCPARPARGLRMGTESARGNRRAGGQRIGDERGALVCAVNGRPVPGAMAAWQGAAEIVVVVRPGRVPAGWVEREDRVGGHRAADVAPGPSRRWGGRGRTDSRAVVVPGCRGGRSGGTEPRWGPATVTEPAAAVAAGPPVGW